MYRIINPRIAVHFERKMRDIHSALSEPEACFQLLFTIVIPKLKEVSDLYHWALDRERSIHGDITPGQCGLGDLHEPLRQITRIFNNPPYPRINMIAALIDQCEEFLRAVSR